MKLQHLIKSMAVPEHIKLTLVDVGARWGFNPPWNQLGLDRIQYFGFEPDPEEFSKLTATSLYSQINYLPFALLDKVGRSKLYITKEPGCSSTLPPNSDFLNKFYEGSRWDVMDVLEIDTTTLDKVSSEINFTADAIKIDVQGAAFEVLQGGSDLLDSILLVDVETEFQELYLGQKKFQDVVSLLADKGFQLFDLNKHWARRIELERINSTRGQVMFADAVFLVNLDVLISRVARMDRVEVRETVYRYILLACLYGHFDLAIEAAGNENFLLNEQEVSRIRSAIEKFTRMTTLVNLSSKIPIIGQAAGVVGSCLTYLQGKDRLLGWGSDYNSAEKRYRYLHATTLRNPFRK